ncbi:MAG TPA: STM4014 family protein, partial [Ktedonobacteraceae bacterium]|nr:STM4014 family protein [Ktedonobacteraceae bacterium]
LLALMQEKHWSQVFVKLAHGSSASGVVAYRRQGEHHQATTTVEMLREKQDMRLYNTRKIRVYRKQSQIAELIDALCAQRVQVERWLPKAGYQNSTFDIRVVTIGGKARHSIARLSAGPLTNLHLLNAREDIDKIRERLSDQIWTQAIEDCERAANLFRSLYTGVDLLFTVDIRHHAIVEMNAFGDLLPGLLYNGQDTYTAELVLAISQQWSKKAEIIGEGLPHA